MAVQGENSELLSTLKALKSDPMRVLDLYPQLHRARLFVLVQSGSEANLDAFAFLTYPTQEGIRGLPVFTSTTFILRGIPADAVTVGVDGPDLWKRLLDVVDPKNSEVEVDPGQLHSIRLRWDMILGMVSKYGRDPGNG
jgi:hypothetical protein